MLHPHSSPWIVGAACAAFVLGCGSSLPEAADPKVGEGALLAALDSWLAGGTAEDLQKRSPPIWFNEPECRAGTKLLKYELVEPIEPYGRQLRCAVKLSLAAKHGGGSHEKKIGYQIETNPHIVIAREGL